MLIVTVTGGIGSGKSSIVKGLAELGYPTLDLDKVWNEAMWEPPVLEGLVKLFGSDGVNAPGPEFKSRIAERVFSNPKELAKLEAYAHPIIRERTEVWLHELKSPVAIIEDPLAKGFYYRPLVVVSAPEETRIQRVQKRNGWTREQVLARMAMQIPEQSQLNQADFVVFNDSTEEGLKDQICVLELYIKTLLKLRSSHVE
jgi:dephospho-CoA kinase